MTEVRTPRHRRVLPNRRFLLVGTIVVAVAVVVSAQMLTFVAFFGLWSLILTVGVIVASFHDFGDGAES